MYVYDKGLHFNVSGNKSLLLAKSIGFGAIPHGAMLSILSGIPDIVNLQVRHITHEDITDLQSSNLKQNKNPILHQFLHLYKVFSLVCAQESKL